MSVRRSERSIYVGKGVPVLNRRRFRAALPVLILVSIGLLALSRLEHPAVRELRWRIAEFMTPIMSTILVPLEPVRWLGQRIPDMLSLTRQLEELRDENQRLKGWEWRARELERKLDEINGLSRVVADPNMEFVTVRIVANSSGAFVRSAMINAGSEQRVKPDFPVVSGDGLVGRVVESGKTAARILFLTDLNSRVPVLVGQTGVRAVLVGDNGPTPRLAYTAGDGEIKAGDEVATSGIGGIFPRGLRIGSVVETPRGLRVKPNANLDQLEYVSVLFYTSPVIGETGPEARGSASAMSEGRREAPIGNGGGRP